MVARGLTKRFGDFVAVDGIDFEIGRGESYGLLGPNGAGKTSTMRMIACMSPVSDGTLRVLGMDPAHDGSTHPGPDRHRAPGGHPRPRAHRPRQPDGLRPVLRPAPAGHPRARRAAARVHPARRAGPRQGGPAVGRDEAPAHHRPVAHLGPRDPDPRRAHHRPRPPGSPPPVGPALPVEATRRHPDHHHPLHGRGRAALRPPGRHGRRHVRGRGRAQRAHRPVLDARGARAALPRPRHRHRRRGDAASKAWPSASRPSPTGCCSTPTTARPRWPRCTGSGSAPTAPSSAGPRSKTSFSA